MAELLKEYTILVPLFDNAGRAFPSQIIAQLEDELLTTFGGFTRQDSMHGVWAAPDGTVFRDTVCSYTVASSARNARTSVLALARRWCVQLGQLAIYVRLPGGALIVSAPVEQAPH